MLHARQLASLLFLTPILLCRGAESSTSEQVTASLSKATRYLESISTEGGYLWRYSKDLSERWGEEKATDTQIWVQPPGTPSVGEAFLAAYKATGAEEHLTAARHAAMALARGQLESGGWAYLVEFDLEKRSQWAYRVDGSEKLKPLELLRNTTTFDDNNTQSALLFLMDYLGAATNQSPSGLEPIKSALQYGLMKMVEAQYPNGAWPQRWDGQAYDTNRYPVQHARIPEEWLHSWPHTPYGGFYTLNDSAQLDCIETMLAAFRHLDDKRWLEAAERGGEFLILAQLPEPQPGWAQQYNFNMEPAWARAFEPPAVCSSESAVAMRTLVDVYVETGDSKFLEPIPSFLQWLNRSQLETNRWARLYELGTNKPIYGDRDGEIHYTLAEISAERQRGYSWQGSYGIPEAIRYYEAVIQEGRDTFQRSAGNETDWQSPSGLRVERILEQQRDNGCWLRGDWVDMRTMVLNMRSLAAYLETLPQIKTP